MGCRSVWMVVGFFWQMARNENQLDLHVALVLYKNSFSHRTSNMKRFILGLKEIGFPARK
jgi:hypothetical protein